MVCVLAVPSLCSPNFVGSVSFSRCSIAFIVYRISDDGHSDPC